MAGVATGISFRLMEPLFWICLAALLYTYVGYPAVLLVLRLFVSKPVRKASIEPFVSIIIPAHNEGHIVEAKLRNSTSLQYPADRLEVIVASDGSVDKTVELAAGFGGPAQIRVLAFRQNRGKMSVLNDAVRESKGEILVLTDASAMLEPDSVRHLVANFADPDVGAVCGLYRVRQVSGARLGLQEQFYWKYETFMKTIESQLSSTIGAHGAILAVRRRLYPFPSPETINDDCVIPLRVLARGARVVYETQAVAVEDAGETTGFQRRARLMAGNLQQLKETRGLLWPPQVLPLLFFLSRKSLRSFGPLLMILLAISNSFLLSQPLYRTTEYCQIAFYVLAIVGKWFDLRPSLLRLPYYFCSVNATYLWSAFRYIRGARAVKWE
jgi:biofilm PGA synthesis N-glycosyltransferase PgaC